MTLDHPVRGVVRDVLDVDVVPDKVVLAVEGDEELIYLSRAIHNVRLATWGERREVFEPIEAQLIQLAEERVEMLIEIETILDEAEGSSNE